MALVVTGFDEVSGDPIWADDGNDYTGTTDLFTPNEYGATEITNTAGPGETGYGWRYFSDGTAISPDGVYYQSGTQVYDPTNSTTLSGLWSRLTSGSLTGANLANYLAANPKQVAGIVGGLAGYMTGSATPQKVGYQGPIPQYTAVREAVKGVYDPNRRPGSGGQQYFTDTQYVPKANAAEIEAARAAARQQAEQMAAANAANPARQVRMAQGGLASLAAGRYLQGDSDGMADELPAEIDGDQPAKLSHGEFVVPADVVSHLGNGNSDAGAKKLYSMMDKIRMARTGTKKQGKEINADKYIHAAMGGSVGYAAGGDVKGYAGTTGSLVDTTRPTYESNLSTWAGPYVTEMLGRGQAAAATPYQAYQGPLTAGPSGLQQQAFTGYGNLQTPAGIGQATQTAGNISGQMQDIAGLGFYTPDTFGTQQAQQYMNPYLQVSLAPQLAEARRQAQISNLQNMSKLTQAGAYGGGRQAIMQSEADRNLAQNLASITGQGLNTAYQQAMAQFNADQARQQQAQQFGATFGLQGLQGALQAAQAQGSLAAQQNQANLANLAAQTQAGAAQRGIESEGLAADLKQFEEQRDYPLKMAQYMSSLLPNLPLATQGSQTTTTNALQNASGGAASVIQALQNLGLLKAGTTT